MIKHLRTWILENYSKPRNSSFSLFLDSWNNYFSNLRAASIQEPRIFSISINFLLYYSTIFLPLHIFLIIYLFLFTFFASHYLVCRSYLTNSVRESVLFLFSLLSPNENKKKKKKQILFPKFSFTLFFKLLLSLLILFFLLPSALFSIYGKSKKWS